MSGICYNDHTIYTFPLYVFLILSVLLEAKFVLKRLHTEDLYACMKARVALRLLSHERFSPARHIQDGSHLAPGYLR